MTEKELRRMVQMEAQSYETNFRGIDILMKYEDDYHTAGRENDYSFSNCPSTYDCLDKLGVIDLCSTNSGIKNTVEECKECWKQALQKGKENE